MATPKIIVGVAAFNNEKCLIECLDSVYVFTGFRSDVGYILVDNGSTDETGAMMDEWTGAMGEHAHCIHVGENSGCSEGWNYIFEKCKEYDPNPEWLILLNSDIQILRKDWVGELLACVKDDVAVVEALGVLHHPGGQLQHVGSAATLYRFSALYELWAEEEHRRRQRGPWDSERFFIWESDIDVFNALRSRGWWPALASQGVHVLHLCGKTSNAVWMDKADENKKKERAVLDAKWSGQSEMEREWWDYRKELGCIESLRQSTGRSKDPDRIKELYPWL